MKKPQLEMEWTLVTVTAAGLLVALLASCAPTHRSFPLADLQATHPVTPPLGNTAPNPQSSPPRSSALAPAVVGNWFCEDADGCAASKISLMPDGSALVDGQKAILTIEQKSLGAIHITLHVPAHDGTAGTTLDGDVNVDGDVDQISLNGAIYARADDTAGLDLAK